MNNNIWLLLKIQLLDLFGINKALHIHDKKERLKLWGIIAVIIVSAVMIINISVTYNYGLAVSLEMFDSIELLPVIIMVTTCVISLFTSIYKVNGVIFGFKDYDMLMALPINTSAVVISRILMLNVYNILFTVVFMIPAGVIYSIKASPDYMFFIIYAITLFFVPLVPIIVATFIGFIINFISARFKHANLMNLILSISFMIIIFIAPYLSKDVSFDFTNMKEAVINKLNLYYPLAKLYSDAVVNYNIISMLLFIVISTFLFGLFVFLIAIKYKSINTILSSKNASSNYKVGELKQSSQLIALYKKEMKRYLTSPLYVLNTGFGVVLLTLASFGILILGFDKMGKMLEIPDLSNIIKMFAPLAISIFIVTNYTTACSVSLEGINLWIIKTMPIGTETIFLSKIFVNLTVLIPAILINSTLISIALKPNVIQAVLIFITPINYAVYISLAGLVINLHLPKMNWVSEVVVIKQSAASLVAMLAGIASVFLPIMVIIKSPLLNPTMVVVATTMIITVVNILLYKYLFIRGKRIFNKL